MKWKAVGAVVLVAMLVMTTVPVMTKATDTPAIDTQSKKTEKIVKVCIGKLEIHVNTKGDVTLDWSDYAIENPSVEVKKGTTVKVQTIAKVRIADHYMAKHEYWINVTKDGDTKNCIHKKVWKARGLLAKLLRFFIGHPLLGKVKEIVLDEISIEVSHDAESRTIEGGEATIWVEGFGCCHLPEDVQWDSYCVNINVLEE